MATKRIYLRDHEEALRLFGPHDKNIRTLERQLGVQIFVRPGSPGERGNLSLVIRGASVPVDRAVTYLENMRQGRQIEDLNNAEAGTVSEKSPLKEHIKTGQGDVIFTTVSGKNIRPMSPAQYQYVEAISKTDLVVAIGPAGTGKTLLAVACAMAALDSGKVGRVMLTRPVVEAGEKLGFLPGDLYDKVNPYLRPLYDAFYLMVGPERFRRLKDEEAVEIVPLAYMRGRTLDDAFVILDEGQNATPEQMKMFLTRMGLGSQTVITGDITQIDLENNKQSGLVQIREILRDLPGITFVTLSEQDVVRHGLVKQIIRAYETWDKGRG